MPSLSEYFSRLSWFEEPPPNPSKIKFQFSFSLFFWHLYVDPSSPSEHYSNEPPWVNRVWIIILWNHAPLKFKCKLALILLTLI